MLQIHADFLVGTGAVLFNYWPHFPDASVIAYDNHENVTYRDFSSEVKAISVKLLRDSE